MRHTITRKKTRKILKNTPKNQKNSKESKILIEKQNDLKETQNNK